MSIFGGGTGVKWVNGDCESIALEYKEAQD